MKILTIKKSSSEKIMVIDITGMGVTIEILRKFIVKQTDCSQVSAIQDGNSFTFQLPDESVIYTITDK